MRTLTFLGSFQFKIKNMFSQWCPKWKLIPCNDIILNSSETQTCWLCVLCFVIAMRSHFELELNCSNSRVGWLMACSRTKFIPKPNRNILERSSGSGPMGSDLRLYIVMSHVFIVIALQIASRQNIDGFRLVAYSSLSGE